MYLRLRQLARRKHFWRLMPTCTPFPYWRYLTVINRALKVLREYHQLNEIETASRLSISLACLRDIEAGRCDPSLDIVQRYADQFKIPLPSLLIFSETLGAPRKHSKVKKYISGEMLRILEWIANGNGHPKKVSKQNLSSWAFSSLWPFKQAEASRITFCRTSLAVRLGQICHYKPVQNI